MANVEKVVILAEDSANATRCIEVSGGNATLVAVVESGTIGRSIVIVTSGNAEKIIIIQDLSSPK